MLRVQLSLGREENIGEIHIQRDADDEGDEIGNYDISLYAGPWKMDKHPVRRSRIEGHQRKNGAWFLAYCAIQTLTTFYMGDEDA